MVGSLQETGALPEIRPPNIRLGVDLGGTKIEVIALARDGQIRFRARTPTPRSIADLPKTTPQAEAFAKQLKAQGYRFIGPTSAYVFPCSRLNDTSRSTCFA